MRDEIYWDEIAADYDNLYSTDWSKSEDRDLGLRLGRALSLSSGADVLDLGCGTGLGFELLSSHGSVNYTGLDISSAMLEQLISKFPQASIVHGPSADAERLLGGRTFDLIIAINVAASFFSEPEAALSTIAHFLNKGGVAYISFLNRWSLRRFIHGRFARREAYLTRGDRRRIDPIQATAVSAHEIAALAYRLGLEPIDIGWRSVLGGVYEGRFAIMLERALERFMPRLGHEVYVILRK